MNNPIFLCNNSKQGSNGNHLRQWWKRVMVIHAFLLCKALCYEPCFVSFNFTVWILFYHVHLLRSNNTFSLCQVFKTPRTIVFKCLYFILHCCHPIFVLSCLFKRLWFYIGANGNKKRFVTVTKIFIRYIISERIYRRRNLMAFRVCMVYRRR